MRNTLLLLLLILMPFAIAGCFENVSGTEDENENENGTEEEEIYSHVQAPGLSANDFLSNENFDQLFVEIDYMEGYAPDEDALESLAEFLERRLNKTTVRILTPTVIPTPEQNLFTADNIRDLEDQHRTFYTEGDTLFAYMIILDGVYEQENVFGVAYYNTSTAIFGPAFDQATIGFGTPSRSVTEATVFRHEFGHLLGLVGIPNSGTEMVTNHQDEEHGNHCNNNSCLMYYALENPDIFGLVLGDDVPELGAFCIQDLQGNGGK